MLSLLLRLFHYKLIKSGSFSLRLEIEIQVLGLDKALDFIPGDSCRQSSLFNGEDGCTCPHRHLGCRKRELKRCASCSEARQPTKTDLMSTDTGLDNSESCRKKRLLYSVVVRQQQHNVLADPELMSNSKKNMRFIPLRECEHLFRASFVPS